MAKLDINIDNYEKTKNKLDEINKLVNELSQLLNQNKFEEIKGIIDKIFPSIKQANAALDELVYDDGTIIS